MGGGTSIRSQPANFAREANPASQIVKILLKDYIQYKRLYTKDKKERKHTLEPHSLKTISRKETTVQPTKATEGSSEKGDTHTQAKPTQSPRKPQYSQRRRPRGGQREGRHTHSSKTTEPGKPQYSQQRRPRETHSNRTKKDKMKRVTNDLTDTAIGSPLASEKTAPAPRPKTFKKQR